VTESAVSTVDTQTRMFNAIRDKTLKRLIAVYRSYQEETAKKGGLAAFAGSFMAPPTSYIMQFLKCSRRSAHDYRLTIQFMVHEDEVTALFEGLKK